MTNCRYCDAVTSNYVYDVCAKCSGYANFAKQRHNAQLQEGARRMVAVPRLFSDYIKMVEHDILNSAAVPHWALTGTPVPETAFDAEERRHRRTLMDKFDDMQVSLNLQVENELRWLVDQGFPLDELEMVVGHPVQGPRVVPHLRHLPTNGRLVSFPATPEGRIVDRHVDKIREALAPQPPTLSEWLGDRVSELGRWAEVLREQPVPAGRIVKWEWREPCWLGFDRCGGRYTLGLHTVFDVVTGDRLRDDAFDMCLFTRHPDVKPEPKPTVRTWFGNEEEP
jgi:hypothetical protein